MEGAEARLDSSPPGGPLKVSIAKLSGGPAWHVQLLSPAVPCNAGKRQSVSFRARAAKPRSIGFAVVKGQSPGDVIGPAGEVSLTPEWQSFRYDFQPKNESEQARLRFNLGSDKPGVELADVAFNPQLWFLRKSPDSSASLEAAPGFPLGVRVIPGTASDGEQSRYEAVTGPSFPVVEGREYYVSLRGRADQPRGIAAKVLMAHEPWESLGFAKLLDLGTEWRSFGFSFKATASEPAAQFDLVLGGRVMANDTPVAFEFAGVRPAAEWNLSSGSQQGAVLTFAPVDALAAAAEGGQAPTSADVMRVDVGQQSQPESWRVRVAATPRPVRGEAEYEVIFKARAERPRDLIATLRQVDSGDTLGLAWKVSLTDSWKSFARRFVAKATTEQASFGFELGGNDASVEIAEATMRKAAKE